MACAKLHNNPTKDLYINIKTPNVQDLNFNKEGKLKWGNFFGQQFKEL